MQHDSPAYFSSGPIVDVTAKRWGADPKGVSDSGAKINAAINFAASKGIQQVYIPSGTYIIETPILLPQFINLFGGGWLTILKIKNATDIDCIRTVDLGYHTNIKSLVIDCNKQNNTFVNGGSGINGHFDTSFIEYVRIRNCSKTAMRINDDASIRDALGYLNTIRYNHIEDSDIGIKWSWRSTDSWCYYNNIGSDYINFLAEGGPVRVIGNHFDGFPQYNVWLEGGDTHHYADNILENAGKNAFYSPTLGYENAFKNISIVGNIIRTASREIDGNYDLINMNGRPTTKGNGLIIASNQIISNNERTPRHAISLKDVTNVSIYSNSFVGGYDQPNPIRFDSVSASQVAGNVPSNTITTV